MPLPKPKPGEKSKNFIARFMMICIKANRYSSLSLEPKVSILVAKCRIVETALSGL